MPKESLLLMPSYLSRLVFLIIISPQSGITRANLFLNPVLYELADTIEINTAGYCEKDFQNLEVNLSHLDSEATMPTIGCQP